jgi:hypothetical protein
MAEQPGGGSKPLPQELEVDTQEGLAPLQGGYIPRGPLPSYGRFQEPVTKVDDQIDRRISAMQAQAEEPANESTDVGQFRAEMTNPGRVAANTSAEMLPPAPLPPTLLGALRQSVRFAGGELPLWGVMVPAFVAMAVIVGLVAAAATAREVIVTAPVEAPTSSASALSSAAPAPSAIVQAPASAEAEERAPAPVKKPLTLVERAAQGEGEALKVLESKPAAELSVEEALAIADGRTQRDLGEARALRGKLADDPALIKNQAVLSELYGYTQDPTTARDALAAIAAIPGPIGADMLYAVWTGTPTKTEITELARSLLLGKTIRAKASPALSAALELRAAERCEDALAVLPRVIQEGDKRSFVTLSRMQRKSGCGANKRLDCYPCLRKGSELKDAMKAVKLRREPQPFR